MQKIYVNSQITLECGISPTIICLRSFINDRWNYYALKPLSFLLSSLVKDKRSIETLSCAYESVNVDRQQLKVIVDMGGPRTS